MCLAWPKDKWIVQPDCECLPACRGKGGVSKDSKFSAARLPQFSRMSQEVTHHIWRSNCQEVINIDSTQSNDVMRQNLKDKAEFISSGLFEYSAFLSDKAKRLVDLRQEDAVMLALRGKGYVRDGLGRFL